MTPGVKDTLNRTLYVQKKKFYNHHSLVQLIFNCEV